MTEVSEPRTGASADVPMPDASDVPTEACRIPSSWRDAGRPGEVRRYVIAATTYGVLGLAVKEVLAWWTYGMIFLLLALWTAPALRERRRRSER